MFALSQTTSYALLALSCLARAEGAWHLAGDVSGCVNVPLPYLSKILHKLSRAGIVETKRGYQGGYRLARPAVTIRLIDIVRAVEDLRIEESCMLGMRRCSDEQACSVHEFWKSTRANIVAQLEAITVVDLARIDEFHGPCCPPEPLLRPTRGGSKARARAAGKKRRDV